MPKHAAAASRRDARVRPESRAEPPSAPRGVREDAVEPLAEEILRFWFGGDGLAAGDAAKRWFSADPAFDEEIRRRFGSLPERAASGEFAHWTAEPRSALALVLVLDQFPRNLYRESPRAFALDRQ